MIMLINILDTHIYDVDNGLTKLWSSTKKYCFIKLRGMYNITLNLEWKLRLWNKWWFAYFSLNPTNIMKLCAFSMCQITYIVLILNIYRI